MLLCKEFQKRAEDEIRFQSYAETIPDDQVSTLSEDWQNSIHHRSVDRHKFKDQDLVWANQLYSKWIKTAQAEFVREMKKCIVMRQMKAPRMKEFFKQKRIDLRLVKKQVPFYGTIGKVQFSQKLHVSQQML